MKNSLKRRPHFLFSGYLVWFAHYVLRSFWPIRDHRVRCIIATPNRDKVLVVHERFGSQRWSLPGGGQQRGENPSKAAQRELHEELGLKITTDQIEPLGKIYQKRGLYRGEFTICEVVLQQMPSLQQNFEIADIAWVSYSDISRITKTGVVTQALSMTDFKT